MRMWSEQKTAGRFADEFTIEWIYFCENIGRIWDGNRWNEMKCPNEFALWLIFCIFLLSPPSRGRGLKCKKPICIGSADLVAPLAGAWIEISPFYKLPIS